MRIALMFLDREYVFCDTQACLLHPVLMLLKKLACLKIK